MSGNFLSGLVIKYQHGFNLHLEASLDESNVTVYFVLSLSLSLSRSLSLSERCVQKDVYKVFKRKSTEPICTPRECKPSRRESINFKWKLDPHNPNRIDWHEVRTLSMRMSCTSALEKKKNNQKR